jgi:hypothetical protein
VLVAAAVVFAQQASRGMMSTQPTRLPLLLRLLLWTRHSLARQLPGQLQTRLQEQTHSSSSSSSTHCLLKTQWWSLCSQQQHPGMTRVQTVSLTRV